jgi:hypothetical protein
MSPVALGQRDVTGAGPCRGTGDSQRVQNAGLLTSRGCPRPSAMRPVTTKERLLAQQEIAAQTLMVEPRNEDVASEWRVGAGLTRARARPATSVTNDVSHGTCVTGGTCCWRGVVRSSSRAAWSLCGRTLQCWFHSSFRALFLTPVLAPPDSPSTQDSSPAGAEFIPVLLGIRPYSPQMAENSPHRTRAGCPQATKRPRFRGLQMERMMGLEPTTFCMAKAGGRSRPFARVRRNLLFAGLRVRRANGSPPERTSSAAIAAMPRCRI